MRYLDMAVSPELFRKQTRYLAEVFRVKTLTSAVAALNNSKGLPGDTAVITVDDGYADNFQPLLEAVTEFGTPSTLYLTTDCIDLARPTTVMWIMLAIHHAEVESIDLSDTGCGFMWIRTPKEKESAIQKLDQSLRALSAARRMAVIERLIEKTGRCQLIRQLGQSAMLRWDQIQLLHSAGIEMGAHTLTHPRLSCLDSEAARREIAASVERVKTMMAMESVSFAYPYGGYADVNEAVVGICRKSGASAAVMLVGGDVPVSDLFRIPRMMVTSDLSTNPWGGFSRAMWACELEGLIDVARKLARCALDL
jgi:peptidoglycan/xylan/chitin deacetylase (PgdA/CDA1 family)